MQTTERALLIIRQYKDALDEMNKDPEVLGFRRRRLEYIARAEGDVPRIKDEDLVRTINPGEEEFAGLFKVVMEVLQFDGIESIKIERVDWNQMPNPIARLGGIGWNDIEKFKVSIILKDKGELALISEYPGQCFRHFLIRFNQEKARQNSGAK